MWAYVLISALIFYSHEASFLLLALILHDKPYHERCDILPWMLDEEHNRDLLMHSVFKVYATFRAVCKLMIGPI